MRLNICQLAPVQGLILAAIAACSAPPEIIDAPALNALPDSVRTAVVAAETGVTITDFERKENEGRVYFDVEAKRPDGSDIEFDVLLTGDRAEIVEIQRDIVWSDVQANVRAAAESAGSGVPVRIIESRQLDGSVIYELFAAGQPKDPAMEVRLSGETAQVLTSRWPH